MLQTMPCTDYVEVIIEVIEGGKISCLAADLFPIYDYQTGPDWVRCRQKSIQLLLSQLNQVT